MCVAAVVLGSGRIAREFKKTRASSAELFSGGALAHMSLAYTSFPAGREPLNPTMDDSGVGVSPW